MGCAASARSKGNGANMWETPIVEVNTKARKSGSSRWNDLVPTIEHTPVFITMKGEVVEYGVQEEEVLLHTPEKAYTSTDSTAEPVHTRDGEYKDRLDRFLDKVQEDPEDMEAKVWRKRLSASSAPKRVWSSPCSEREYGL
eukprot:gb/GFBE01004702.1/.p1 GENE.gb/GFBE01004702.1/~~gb/GFBE01004702.1/.p1  ORF type:complete len:141 (+),score=14.64 gb/GFBE01004702.1/:1-423(+)